MFIKSYISKTTGAPVLAVFRLLFGILMFIGIIRFWYHGWIEKLYIQPKFFFSYYGFEWVKPLGNYTCILFIICGVSALLIAVGLKYRLAIIIFFLSFTYIELMDKTTYLNHYYFVSILSFLLIFLPANATFSIDSFLRKKEYRTIPGWTVDSIKLLLGIVYFYAGLAKLNSDWLFRAMPLKIWLPSKYDVPLIGNSLMQQNWFHYTMSWSGVIYDLTIPFLLLNRKTRSAGFILVVIFHIFTGILFPIGMFPYIMITGSLIFFDTRFHEKIIHFLKSKITFLQYKAKQIEAYQFRNKIPLYSIVLLLVFQLVFPWRYLLYPGELFWTEEGYRFSWRVMLMEKAGYTNFKIVDGKTKQFFYVENSDFLTSFQEKQMAFQPDFILEYAHCLGDYFKEYGYKNIEVYADSYVALNGRSGERFIDSKVNLYKQKDSFKHKHWILPFTNEIKIKGL